MYLIKSGTMITPGITADTKFYVRNGKMEQKLFYLFDAGLYCFVALYFIYSPQIIFKILKRDENSKLGIIIKNIFILSAIVNIIKDMNKFFH